ncbi:MAG: phenylalanine--tRNA ligase subunit beta [Nitriliruptorales bacterium]|nr:phenylalanine--tRNA ligase subunit beta [Nitriliruptorales bacterium]
MKVPLSWLREFVDVTVPLDELVDLLGMRNLEVEEVRHPGDGTRGVVAVEVLDRRPHPNADKLQLVEVTDGRVQHQVVCGAWNFEVGDVVFHAPPGSSIPGGTLEARELRGVTSHGMLLSARELEAGDMAEGLWRLDGAEPGSDAHDLVALGEPVIEIAVQADRGDHLSILGVAHDLAAILDSELRIPAGQPAPGAGSIPITISAPDGCQQFVGRHLSGITVGPSRPRVQFRLAQCSVRAISNVVDVTNYVMLELGQPLHAFDAATLTGPLIDVRTAEPGEHLTTLDDVDRTLEPTDLVVADGAGAAALAGVMGGAATEVTAATTEVLLEAATWDPLTIRRTSRRLGLVSEASTRFERHVDPGVAQLAVARAVELLAETSSVEDHGETVARVEPEPRDPVSYDPSRWAAFLGLDLDGERQSDLLRRAGCEVEESGTTIRVRAPSWRADLDRAVDLAEEVARLHGYEHIPATLPAIRVAGGLTASQHLERSLLDVTAAHGFNESRTRPFVGERALMGVMPSPGRVTLANPLAKDAAHLRPSLVEGLLGVLRHNSGQGFAGAAVFEYGRIFRPADDPLSELLADVEPETWRDHADQPLPVQPRTIGLAAQGRRQGPGWTGDGTWAVSHLLAAIDDVVRLLSNGRGVVTRRPVEVTGWHPGRTVELLIDDRVAGIAGELHPREAADRDLPEPVLLAELVVEPWLSGRPDFDPPALVRHPPLTIDVALVAPDDVPYGILLEAVEAGAGDLLADARWFDEYRGDQVGPGLRSVAIRLRLQTARGQLTDEDGEGVIRRIGEEAAKRGARLRG